MYDTRQDLLDALRAAPEILAAVLAGHPATPPPTVPGDPPSWSAREMVGHLRDAEAAVNGQEPKRGVYAPP